MPRCRDDWTGREFKSKVKHIDLAASRLNVHIATNGNVTVNDFYELMEWPTVDAGKEQGWTEPVHVRFSSDLDDKFKPILTFSFIPAPKNILSELHR